MNTKLRIVCVGHFTNKSIQKRLLLWKKADEFAPWLPYVFDGISRKKDVDLFIISPHRYLKKDISFCEDRVNYTFFNYRIPFSQRHWPSFFRFDLFTNFFSNTRKINKYINKTNPDIVILLGAENSYYSASILKLDKKFPVLVVIQGFASLMRRGSKISSVIKNRIKNEEEILRSFSNYCGELDSENIIKKYNDNFKFYKFYYSYDYQDFTQYQKSYAERKYDCLFYGRLENDKGIEDFIKVVKELMQSHNIKACVIGLGNPKIIEDLIAQYNCKSNIDFLGFIPTKEELYEKVSDSKILCVPTYNDRLPATIREAMFMKIPIVAYPTGGIPYMNNDQSNLFITKKNNYKEMANLVNTLLTNDKLAIELAEKAFNFAKSEFDLDTNTNKLISACKEILNEV
jgi:glycosyltransferase involved in cell wall biosynthesis